MPITPTQASQPIIKNPITNILVPVNADNTSLDLLNNFDDPSTTGQTARFEFYQPELFAGGVINVLLYDQGDTGAPLTVQNFFNYVNSGRYVDNIFHRSVKNSDGSDFVIQGGLLNVTGDNIVSEVPTDDPVQNEYSSNRENILGTIAMAKVPENRPGGGPDSATSNWFFNMGDNTFLKDQNGGFTTFGQIIDDSGLTVAETVADLPTFNVTIQDTTPPTNLDNLPLLGEPAGDFIAIDDYVRLTNITSFQQPELTFSVVSNSNPDLVNVSFDGQQMILDYQGNTEGSSEITVEATNVFGQTIQDTFSVNINNSLDTQLIRFQNSDRPGTFLFATEGESVSIRENFPNFIEEGPAFKVASQPGDDLIRFNRFQNSAVPGTYLYANETESVSIRQNFTNFVEEGIAFYAFDANAEIGVDYYRMQNTQQPGTYIFVNQEERDQILANFPQFVDEGVAFEVGI